MEEAAAEAGPGLGEEAFKALLQQARRGETAAVLAAVDQDKRLLIRTGGYGYTLLHRASKRGHVELVGGLLDRGAGLSAKSETGCDALFYACRNDCLSVAALLLDRGADPNTSDGSFTALGTAALNGNHDVCLLLLSRSADLMAPMPGGGRSALDMYGEGTDLRFSPAELAARRAALVAAWEEGPHPSQVQRRKDVRWDRRLPLMCVAVGCGFLPLAGCPYYPPRRSWLGWAQSFFFFLLSFRRRAPRPAAAAAAAVVVDTARALPAVDRSTLAANRAYLQGQVLGNRDLLRQVAAFV